MEALSQFRIASGLPTAHCGARPRWAERVLTRIYEQAEAR